MCSRPSPRTCWLRRSDRLDLPDAPGHPGHSERQGLRRHWRCHGQPVDSPDVTRRRAVEHEEDVGDRCARRPFGECPDLLPGPPSRGAGRGCAATSCARQPLHRDRPGSYGPAANPHGGQRGSPPRLEHPERPGHRLRGRQRRGARGRAREAIIGVGGTQVISAFRGEFLIARYTVDGDIDTHFSGPNGAIETPFPDGAGSVSSCVYDPQAKTLTVAGGVFTTDRAGVGLARYLLSG